MSRSRKERRRRAFSSWLWPKLGTRKGVFSSLAGSTPGDRGRVPRTVARGEVSMFGRQIRSEDAFSLTRGEANVLRELGVPLDHEWYAHPWVTVVLDTEPSHARRCELIGFVIEHDDEFVCALSVIALMNPDLVVPMIDDRRALAPDYTEYDCA
jgi:hypothetical protein